MLDELDSFLSGAGVYSPPPQEKPEDDLDKYLKSVGVIGGQPKQPEKPADDLDSFLSTQGLSPRGDTFKVETPDEETKKRMAAVEASAAGTLQPEPSILEKAGRSVVSGTGQFGAGMYDIARAAAETSAMGGNPAAVPMGLALGDMAKSASNWSTGQAEKGVQGPAGQVLQAFGKAPGDIMAMSILGPGGMPILGAASGYAQGGVKGMVQGAIEGALSKGIIGGIGKLPTPLQAPALLATGAAITPGTIEDKAVAGLVWTGMGFMGKPGEVTFDDFISAYPKIKSRIDNNRAWSVLKEFTAGGETKLNKKNVAKMGGPQKVLEDLVRAYSTQEAPPVAELGVPLPQGQIPENVPSPRGEMTGIMDYERRFGSERRVGKPLSPDEMAAIMANERRVSERRAPVPEQPVVQPVPDVAGIIPKEQMPPVEPTSITGQLPVEPVAPPKVGGPASGTLAYGQELPKKIGHLNLERIINDGLNPETAGKDVYDTKKVLEEALRDTQERRLAAGVGVTKTRAESRAGAELLGKKFSVEEIAKKFGLATKDLDELTISTKDVVVTIADKVRQAVRDMAANNSEENMARYAVANNLLQRTLTDLEVGSGSIARSLAIHGEPSQVQAFLRAKQYHLVIKTLLGDTPREVTQAILDRAAKMEFATPEEFARFMRDSYKATTKEKVMEAWINSILTNPTTQIANVVGNFSTIATMPLETALTAAVEASREGWSGMGIGKGGKRGVFFSEVGKQYRGMLAGLSEGWKKAVYAWMNETTTSVGKTEMQYNKSAIKGLKGQVIRIPGRTLGAADEFFKTLVYTADLYSGAQRAALSKGLKGDALHQKWAELVNNPTEPMKAHARQEALYRTFQNDLGSFGNKLMAMRNHNIAFRFIMPFMRTPANILKYAYERTPFGVAKGLFKKGLDPLQRSELVSRGMMGTVFMVMAAEMARRGIITGTGQFMDKAERDRKYAEGWRPNSFKIAGKYVSYSRIDPASTIVGIAADLYDLGIRFPSTMKNKDTESAAMSALMSFIGNSVNKTYLRGAFDIFNAMTEPPSSTSAKNKVLRTLATSPIPSLAGATARAVDPYIREVNTMWEAIKNKLPFASKSIRPAIDITGNPIRREGGPIWQMIVPATISTEKKNPVLNELTRLKVSFGMPNKTTKTGKMEAGKYSRMTKQEWDSISKNITAIMSNSYYGKLSDEEKARMLKSIISKERSWIRKLYSGVEE